MIIFVRNKWFIQSPAGLITNVDADAEIGPNLIGHTKQLQGDNNSSYQFFVWVRDMSGGATHLERMVESS